MFYNLFSKAGESVMRKRSVVTHSNPSGMLYFIIEHKLKCICCWLLYFWDFDLLSKAMNRAGRNKEVKCAVIHSNQLRILSGFDVK